MSTIDVNSLDLWLAKAEGKLARLKRKVYAKDTHKVSKIKKRLHNLVEYSKSSHISNVERLEIQRKLAELESRVSNSDDAPDLEEIEREVSSIYGDQSKNDTFYFKRKQRNSTKEASNWYTSSKTSSEETNWYEKSLEDVQKHVNGIYGDQSQNDTYYFRRKRKSSNSRDVTSYNIAPDQYRLKSPEFGAPHPEYDWYVEDGVKDASSKVPSAWENEVGDIRQEYLPPSGYTKNDDMNHWDRDNDFPSSYKVDTEVDTWGDTGGSENLSQAPHMIEESDRVRREFSGVPASVISSNKYR